MRMQRSGALWLALAGLLIGGCGSSTKQSTAPAGKPDARAKYDAPISVPVHRAPALLLRNYDGRWVDLAQYRGRAVLVTFIYTHCPDVCPLIVGNLHTALGQLGRDAHKVKIVADPKGDTPSTVRRFLKAHQMTGRMDYLLGSASQLRRVWARWGIAARRDKKTPELVEHSALIYGITAGGKITVAYPANFKPRWIAHDAPLLAAR